MKLTYNKSRTGSLKVKLDGEYVGSIVRNSPNYWHYQPKGVGTRPGESMSSIAAVVRSLEVDATESVARSLEGSLQ